MNESSLSVNPQLSLHSFSFSSPSLSVNPLEESMIVNCQSILILPSFSFSSPLSFFLLSLSLILLPYSFSFTVSQSSLFLLLHLSSRVNQRRRSKKRNFSLKSNSCGKSLRFSYDFLSAHLLSYPPGYSRLFPLLHLIW